MLNACRADICRLLSPTAFDDIPSVASSLTLQPFPGYQQQPRILFMIANEALAGYVAPSVRVIGGERVSSQACPNFYRRKYYPRCRSNSQHVHYTLIHRQPVFKCFRITEYGPRSSVFPPAKIGNDQVEDNLVVLGSRQFIFSHHFYTKRE